MTASHTRTSLQARSNILHTWYQTEQSDPMNSMISILIPLSAKAKAWWMIGGRSLFVLLWCILSLRNSSLGLSLFVVFFFLFYCSIYGTYTWNQIHGMTELSRKSISIHIPEGNNYTSKWVDTGLFLYVYGLTMCQNLFTINHMFLH